MSVGIEDGARKPKRRCRPEVGASVGGWGLVNAIVGTAAFPPCDHVAVSGARWFAGKGLGKLADSIRLFERAAFW